jgi:hypothetical protein
MRELDGRRPVPGDARQRGRLDVVDLCVGIVLVFALPLVTYVGARATGLAGPKKVGKFREEIKVDVQPDAELISLRIDYVERRHRETGKVLLRLAQEAQGLPRLKERDWAKQCFDRLLGEVATIESQIAADPTLKNQLAAQLTRLAALKSEISEDKRAADSM